MSRLDKLKLAYLRTRHRQVARGSGIPTHLTPEERIALYKLARECSTILEIDSHLGAMTWVLARAISERRHGRVVCVDCWDDEAAGNGLEERTSEFSRNLGVLMQHVRPIRGKREAVIAEVGEVVDRVDLLVMHAGASRHLLETNWLNYRKFTVPGSVVLVHGIGESADTQTFIETTLRPQVRRPASLAGLWWGHL